MSPSTPPSFIPSRWPPWGLESREVLQRNVYLVAIQNALEIFPLFWGHLVVSWLLVTAPLLLCGSWLLSGKIDLNYLIGGVFGPVIVLLVLEEVVNI